MEEQLSEDQKIEMICNVLKSTPEELFAALEACKVVMKPRLQGSEFNFNVSELIMELNDLPFQCTVKMYMAFKICETLHALANQPTPEERLLMALFGQR